MEESVKESGVFSDVRSKIYSIHKINEEIINRINRSVESGEVVWNCVPNVRVICGVDFPCASYPKFEKEIKIEKKNLKKCSAGDLVNGWTTKTVLQTIEDPITQDKIDVKFTDFNDIVRLNEEMFKSARKFDYLEMNDTLLLSLTVYLENFERLQVSLGEIESLLQKDDYHSIDKLISDFHERCEMEFNKIRNLETEKKILLKMNESKKYKQLSLGIARNYSDIIHQWVLPDSKFRLLYKGSRDGFRSGDFHQRCDNYGETLTIIESCEGYIFGGYSAIPWKSDDHIVKVNRAENQQFIFTLFNPHQIPPTKFEGEDDVDIIYFNSCGPVFGRSDIIISDMCNQASSSINFPDSFVDTTNIGKSLFTGSHQFNVSDIEVYEVIELTQDLSTLIK
eukprot:TRINITY_DN1940_c1_g1_i2.p1 TRINITY_DN1940_c1_g1~~TRINITY_DN1940_c1_g1_i2.p1  ORF type:complete len:394 (-),score=56.74 TRINITY_DN1940_c1_g1_i2:385-1566(-)